MSRHKLAAGVAVVALSAIIVTALAGATPEVHAKRPVGWDADIQLDAKANPTRPETPDVVPAVAKGDRFAVRPINPVPRLGFFSSAPTR